MAESSYPRRPTPAVGTVVIREIEGRMEVLLIKRAKAPRAGAWSIPGGRQKLGETLRDAAMREVREETGVEIENIRLLDVVDSITKNDNGTVEYHYSLIDFAADWKSGAAIAGGDAEDVKWLDRDELATMDLWHETRRIIDLTFEQRLSMRKFMI